MRQCIKIQDFLIWHWSPEKLMWRSYTEKVTALLKSGQTKTKGVQCANEDQSSCTGSRWRWHNFSTNRINFLIEVYPLIGCGNGVFTVHPAASAIILIVSRDFKLCNLAFQVVRFPLQLSLYIPCIVIDLIKIFRRKWIKSSLCYIIIIYIMFKTDQFRFRQFVQRHYFIDVIKPDI